MGQLTSQLPPSGLAQSNWEMLGGGLELWAASFLSVSSSPSLGCCCCWGHYVFCTSGHIYTKPNHAPRLGKRNCSGGDVEVFVGDRVETNTEGNVVAMCLLFCWWSVFVCFQICVPFVCFL